MSIQSDKVKKWRKYVKDRVVASMGGKCNICGYNKSQRALNLHHLDPSKKSFGLGAIRADPKKWSLIVNELRKCVLLCANCHLEVHDGEALIPSNIVSFDERYVNFRDSLEVELTPCPVCGNLKQPHLKNCSYACAAKSRYRVNWDNIDLVKELQTKSVLKLSEELGCSDGAVHKRLRKLGLK